MAKRYTRKQVRSLKELDQEQNRIKHKTSQIEDEWLDILNPQQLFLTFLGKFLGKKIKGNKSPQFFTGKQKEHKSSSQIQYPATAKVNGALKHPFIKTFFKKAGISFLKWQVFNLALFLGKKIYKNVREKKGTRAPKLLPVPVLLKKSNSISSKP